MVQLNQYALRSTRVVTPSGVGERAVIVNGQTIAAVVDAGSVPEGVPVEDLGSLVISPGVIDAHVHINEPGREDWEGFRCATRAAAAGGVTTLADMPLCNAPATLTPAALEEKRATALGQCWVDVGFCGGLVPENAREVGRLIEAGVLALKTYLCPSGVAEFRFVGLSEMHAALPPLAAAGVPLMVHCELPSGQFPLTRDVRSYAQYEASRPTAWELDAVALMIGLCRKYRAPVHIAHLSSAEALEMIVWAVEEGLPLTVETCPHYLSFAAEEIADGDTRFKCAPPIRAAANRAALWRALQSGLIDLIASGHAPCPPAMKRLESGAFTAAWGGIASLQLLLPAVWTQAEAHGARLANLASWLSDRPARLLGLAGRKGRIEAGYDADLVIWDPAAEFTVEATRWQHRHKLTPYEGLTLKGVVARTYLRGQPVFDEGLVAEPPLGNLTRRPPTVDPLDV